MVQHATQSRLVIIDVDYDFDFLRLNQLNPQRYPFLLESTSLAAGLSSAPTRTTAPHTTDAEPQHDILFAFPQQCLSVAQDQTVYLDDQPVKQDFLCLLDQVWRSESQPVGDNELPFHGGWFVYLGYELVAQFEPRLQLPRSTSRLPLAYAVRIPAALIRQHQQRRCQIVVEAGYESLAEQMLDDITAARHLTESAVPKSVAVSLWEQPVSDYLDAVQRARSYIYDGDVFQVNLSRRWATKLADGNSPAGVYRHLRRTNPAPFAGMACFENGAVLSSSPERLVRVNERHVETRPIAGTRPRAANSEQDQALLDELIAHPKERAEHIMLIDLERNDLGRLCEFGSVQVEELMALESYAHVHHIVSNVSGKLRREVTPGDVIRAVFPGGTITGCPKVRCMQIIAELEGEARGTYTGSMGYLNHDGSMDLNILIRTIVIENDMAQIRAGAGIVIDSIPERELAETRAKAAGMLRALQVTR